MTPFEVMIEVLQERERQLGLWGTQKDLPDGTNTSWEERAAEAKERTSRDVTWANILLEEAYEAVSEPDVVLLRAELIQVAAVAVAWIEAIDARKADE